MSLQDINREARAWEAQLRDQGLRPTDARRVAQREAGWQGWALTERLAAASPAKWYGPDSPETRTDPAELAAEAIIARARPEFEASQRIVLAQAQARGHTLRPATPQVVQTGPPEPEAHL